MKNAMQWLFNLWGKQKAIQITIAWKQVFDMQDDNVKIVLKDLAVYCNLYNSSFNQEDSHITSFNEGARDVFLHILEMLQLNEEEVLAIIKQSDNLTTRYNSLSNK